MVLERASGSTCVEGYVEQWRQEEGQRRALSEPESGKRQFSSDQIRIMTRAFLESQQPELITDAIDIEPERVETEEDGK